MVCPECGIENAGNSTVCAGCGKELPRKQAKGGRDFAIMSLVLGIVSMLIFPYLYGPFAIIAALIAKKQGGWGKMAITGMVLGIIAVVGYIAIQVLYSCLGIF